MVHGSGPGGSGSSVSHGASREPQRAYNADLDKMPKRKRGTSLKYPLDEISDEHESGRKVDGLVSHELRSVRGGFDGASDSSCAPGYALLWITGDRHCSSRNERAWSEPEKDDCGNDNTQGEHCAAERLVLLFRRPNTVCDNTRGGCVWLSSGYGGWRGGNGWWGGNGR